MKLNIGSKLFRNALLLVLPTILSFNAKPQEISLPNQSNFDIPIAKEPKVIVDNQIQDVFVAAAVQDQLLKGYLGKRMTQNLEERLLKIDEKGIIEGYLHRPGSHPWIGEQSANTWKRLATPGSIHTMPGLKSKWID